jgi:deoxyribonuclease V
MMGMKNKSAGPTRHSWDVTTQEALAIQQKLREKWEGADRFDTIRTVAGLDAAFVISESQSFHGPAGRWDESRRANQAIGCVVLYQFPEMIELTRAHAIVQLKFPYVPGLLSFREIPALLAALQKLTEPPDLLFCDGQGYAHPRRLGLAAHLGVWLDEPTIGCAKSILIGTHGPLAQKAGSWAPLIDEAAKGERIGAVVRTRNGVQPVYVSQGNRVSLETAIRLTLAVTDGFRIPRPTRNADHFSKEIKRKLLQQQLSEK